MYVTATPGKFMMRLRVPNGILNSQQLRYFAEVVEPYGPEVMMMIMVMLMIEMMRMILLHACTYINCRIRMVVFGLIDVVVVVVVGLINVVVVVGLIDVMIVVGLIDVVVVVGLIDVIVVVVGLIDVMVVVGLIDVIVVVVS
jgi:hypothetical protein